MSDDRLRVISLMARHGNTKYVEAISSLQKMFAQQLPELSHDTLVIDNDLKASFAETVTPNLRIIGGDNTAWEFSAWDQALKYLGSRLHDYSFVNLCTSAFRELYVGYLDLFDADMLNLMAGRAAAVGHIDHFNEPVLYAGRSLQSWLRSSFVIMPPTELKLLGSLVSVQCGKGLFSGCPTSPFRDDAPLSAGYQKNIIGWLTGEGTGQGTAWHSRFTLSEETLPFFEAKTVAILNEQMLTSRLRSQGCAIVDPTFLQTCAKRAEPCARTLRTIPDWRIQLKDRLQ